MRPSFTDRNKTVLVRRMKHSKLQVWFLTALAAAMFLLALQAGRWSAPQDNPHSPTLAGPQKNTVYIALALTAAIAASAAALRSHIRNRTEKLHRILAESERIRQELTRQRDKAQMYLDIAAVIIVALDSDGKVSLINKKGVALLALEENQIVGKNWFENFIPERSRSQTQEVFTKLIAGKIEPAEYFENPIVSADGKEKLVAWHNTILKDPDGKITGTLSSGLDITEQHASAIKLQESRRALSTLIGNLPGIAYRCANTPDWPMEFISRGCLEMTGYSDSRFLSSQTCWNNLIYPDDRQMVWDQVQAALAEKKPYQLEYRIRAADGTEKWLWEKGCGIFNPDGSVQAIEGFINDISGQKTAETAREKLLKELQSKNEELESIIYIASHDLKSPLINIQGFAGELKKSCDRLAGLLKTPDQPTEGRKIENIISDDIPESLSFIVSGAAKMDSLLSGLLRLARVGRASVRIAPVDMNRLVKNLMRTFEFQIRKQQAHIEVTELPNCTGDATLISQVFSNLIDNALKYRKADTPLQIRIEGKIENGRVVFAVADNGIGIEPQHHEKVFEIFHQLQPANSSGGQGLGLTIVRRILDRLDGRVRVQSEPGKGSTFIVELPAA